MEPGSPLSTSSSSFCPASSLSHEPSSDLESADSSVLMTSSCFPHLSVRFQGQWHEDPFFLLILLRALAIAESVCVQLAVNHGLGRHQNSLSHSEFVAYSKVQEFLLKS